MSTPLRGIKLLHQCWDGSDVCRFCGKKQAAWAPMEECEHAHRCYCDEVGIMFEGEPPHETAERCKLALYSTLSGYRTKGVITSLHDTISKLVVRHLRTAVLELDVAMGKRNDLLKMTGEKRVTHHVNVARLELLRLADEFALRDTTEHGGDSWA